MLDNGLFYVKLTVIESGLSQEMMEARLSSVIGVLCADERDHRRSIERTMLCGRCWAAGEYVADCHGSGELSLVRSGSARFVYICFVYGHEFFIV